MIAQTPTALAIVCLVGCSMSDPAYRLTTGQRGAPEATRFAVLPVNALAPVSPHLSGAPDRVLGVITRYLKVQGRERLLIERSRTDQLWRASIVEVDESDTLPRGFSSAMKVFTRRLREFADFDALVVASLVFREADLSRRLVKWDGAIRRITDGPEESQRVPDSFTGRVSAVSLNVMVFGARGERLFENNGGIDLAHDLWLGNGEDGTLNAGLRDAVLEEQRYLREGVELAFSPYLRRPRSSDW